LNFKKEQKVRQLVFVRKSKLEWQEAPDPVLQSDEDALVRPLYVARCDLDIPILTGQTPYRPHFPVGHELIARVEKVSENVKLFRAGDIVAVPLQISCGHCARCAEGLTAHCGKHTVMDMIGIGRESRKWGGALSDSVRVPFADAMMVKIPVGLDLPSLASLSDNVCDAYRTVAPYLIEKPGRSVLIVGGGASSISLYAAAIASSLNASKIDFMDTSKERLQHAEKLGASPLERGGSYPQKAGQYDITVDASGDPEGLACAVRSMGPEAVCTAVTLYFRPQSMPLIEMYNTGGTFKTGRVNFRSVIPQALDLIQKGKFKPGDVTTQSASFADAPEAMLTPGTKLVLKNEMAGI